MAISEEELSLILQQKFPNAKIKLKDLAGDQDHYSLEINDPSFKNIPLVKQHKLVNTALAEVLHSKLHAITIKTKHDYKIKLFFYQWFLLKNINNLLRTSSAAFSAKSDIESCLITELEYNEKLVL